MSAVRFTVRGRVQGVGFRAFVRGCALELGVGGWVRNADDGSVEGLAVADDATLARFVARLRVGPRASRVTDVFVDDSEDGPQAAFEVRR